jgi:DNA repair protein RecN (Recombination protein N)
MLRHLRVSNFAILSDVQLELTPGLVVLTGETGAGKSLIVEAVNLLRGGRASADIPRAGAREAVVEAVFDVPEDLRARVRAVLDAGGLPVDADDGGVGDGEAGRAGARGGDDDDDDGGGGGGATDTAARAVVVRRIIARGGKSRTYVNGALTTATRLAELGGLLVDLSGQHEHQGLVDAGRHREILDAFAAEPALPRAMDDAWAELDRIDREVAALTGDERARADRADYLRYQLGEFEEAAPEVGEEERLAAERARLGAIEELAAGARAAVAAVLGDDGGRGASDGGAVVALAQAARELERPARLEPRLATLRRQLDEARVLADDAASELRRYADHVEGDPERLAWIDDRLELYRRLARKHATSPAELPARAAALRAELDALDHRDARLGELTAARATARAPRQRPPRSPAAASGPARG